MRTSMTLDDIYWHGFATKCAEYGVDPEALVKLAQQSVTNGMATASAPVLAKPAPAPVKPIKPIPAPKTTKPVKAEDTLADWNPDTQHKVESGESMWRIAQKYDIPLEALIRMNPHVKNPAKIRPGMIINRSY